MTDAILRKKRGPKPRWVKEHQTRILFLRERISYHADQLWFTLRAYLEMTDGKENPTFAEGLVCVERVRTAVKKEGTA